eukprot:TRINITY_DN13477_c0_g1_i1.p1 TRINITY_DN13477_c0_g1~~TRINITY_DN13477_c0_g1_i1.p1  ORF type:complete len:456 (+),score=96.24 TRINITY_DN13477_c0_g1_i1:140-1507(+)
MTFSPNNLVLDGRLTCDIFRENIHYQRINDYSEDHFHKLQCLVDELCSIFSPPSGDTYIEQVRVHPAFYIAQIRLCDYLSQEGGMEMYQAAVTGGGSWKKTRLKWSDAARVSATLYHDYPKAEPNIDTNVVCWKLSKDTVIPPSISIIQDNANGHVSIGPSEGHELHLHSSFASFGKDYTEGHLFQDGYVALPEIGMLPWIPYSNPLYEFPEKCPVEDALVRKLAHIRSIEQTLTQATNAKEKVEKINNDSRVSKTVASAGTIVSTALLFTPLSLFGAALLATSTATSVGTTIVAGKLKDANIEALKQAIAEEEEATQIYIDAATILWSTIPGITVSMVCRTLRSRAIQSAIEIEEKRSAEIAGRASLTSISSGASGSYVAYSVAGTVAKTAAVRVVAGVAAAGVGLSILDIVNTWTDTDKVGEKLAEFITEKNDQLEAEIQDIPFFLKLVFTTI